ncbi:hypothetical protein BJX63DRAFT_401167 [Aspergillus granulosus]|uniref:Zn(2)-C6 fungal-type domain-containing protein n=1 Tax=Aspergillus granulosus TaxID=176169 RepID=A0ABR4H5L2_9EURO
MPSDISSPSRERPAKYTRSSRACRRCRRLRTKCINDGGQTPCESCRQTGQECIFLRRGEPNRDREFRRPRIFSVARLRQSSGSTPSPSSLVHEDPSHHVHQSISILPENIAEPIPGPPSPAEWDHLPPFDELIRGIHIFTTSFFQLGFVPKTLFFERLRKDPLSVNVFLLFSILSISARFTPSLVVRYGGASNATELFLRQATALVPEQMYIPTLEATQGFFLMGIAEWGKGDKHRSSMHMGIAVNMAGLLRLHREETYRLPGDATAEEIVYAEAARRTFWMLESYNNLLSGLSSLVTFSYGDISTLLPCSEHEFAFGGITGGRAALEGTLPALNDPSLVHCPSRSLFATLLQTHNLWGRVARIVSPDTGTGQENPSQTRISHEAYTTLAHALSSFEEKTPAQHHWSIWNLRGFKAEGLDLAYFSTVMVLRLSNIVLRRRYLHDCHHESQSQSTSQSNSQSLGVDTTTTDLFKNMLVLHEQIDAFFDFRSPDQGFPAMIVFCVYVCGSMANHLHQEPSVCPAIAPRAEEILRKSLTGLGQLQDAWPLAREWNSALCRASSATDTRQKLVDPSSSRSESGGHELFGSGSGDETRDGGGHSPAGVMRLNDPFPTDVMLLEFEAYGWDDIFTGGVGGDQII